MLSWCSLSRRWNWKYFLPTTMYNIPIGLCCQHAWHVTFTYWWNDMAAWCLFCSQATHNHDHIVFSSIRDETPLLICLPRLSPPHLPFSRTEVLPSSTSTSFFSSFGGNYTNCISQFLKIILKQIPKLSESQIQIGSPEAFSDKFQHCFDRNLLSVLRNSSKGNSN